MRIGFGYDSHRFGTSLGLKLAGVLFPKEYALEGHSDADVLVHAVIDALLGASALGDIGKMFPEDDPAWKNADSLVMLELAVQAIERKGYKFGNLDVTVICEHPRISNHVELMRFKLASVIGCEKDQISIKGKTNERMDAVGAGEGIVAHAVCLLDEKEKCNE